MWGHITRRGRCDNHCHGTIRIFEDWQTFGDAYRYSFSFVALDERTIEITGMAVRAPTPDEGRAMLRACKEAGLKVVRERKAGRRQGTREITRHDFAEGTGP
jgi:hypothetical protein